MRWEPLCYFWPLIGCYQHTLQPPKPFTPLSPKTLNRKSYPFPGAVWLRVASFRVILSVSHACFFTKTRNTDNTSVYKLNPLISHNLNTTFRADYS